MDTAAKQQHRPDRQVSPEPLVRVSWAESHRFLMLNISIKAVLKIQKAVVYIAVSRDGDAQKMKCICFLCFTVRCSSE